MITAAALASMQSYIFIRQLLHQLLAINVIIVLLCLFIVWKSTFYAAFALQCSEKRVVHPFA